jgi:DNA-directed RNA polymerase specialized sigma24 family protein
MDTLPPTSSPAGGRLFQTTHWSVVLAAGGHDSSESVAALEELCRAYWYPVYAFVRQTGYKAHDAEDLTQSFFFRLLDHQFLTQADPHKGRFRNFLLVALKNFLANEWDRVKAVKRGGRVAFISVDQLAGGNDPWEPMHNDSPDQAFARTWALVFLERVLGRLRGELGRDEQRNQFDELKVFLTGDPGASPYADVAEKLGTTEAAIKMAVQRLRRRFTDILREEVAHTVARPEEIDDEIRSLLGAVSV